jgi:hypothetical protein
LQQQIAEASDDAAKKYYDEIPKEERSDTKVTAAKTKRHSFKGQFSKYIAIANPKFGDKFLVEVSASFPNPWQFILSLYCYKIDIPSPSFRSRSIGATTRSLRCL